MKKSKRGRGAAGYKIRSLNREAKEIINDVPTPWALGRDAVLRLQPAGAKQATSRLKHTQVSGRCELHSSSIALQQGLKGGVNREAV